MARPWSVVEDDVVVVVVCLVEDAFTSSDSMEVSPSAERTAVVVSYCCCSFSALAWTGSSNNEDDDQERTTSQPKAADDRLRMTRDVDEGMNDKRRRSFSFAICLKDSLGSAYSQSLSNLAALLREQGDLIKWYYTRQQQQGKGFGILVSVGVIESTKMVMHVCAVVFLVWKFIYFINAI
jgi:hypothetical protein